MDLSLTLEVLGKAGPSREHDRLLSLALVPVLGGQNSSLPTPLELRRVRFRHHTAVHLQVLREHSSSTQPTRSAQTRRPTSKVIPWRLCLGSISARRAALANANEGGGGEPRVP